MTTLGEFLTQKVANMAKWLQESGCTVPMIPVDSVGSNVIVTSFAVQLRDRCKDIITERNFVTLRHTAADMGEQNLEDVITFVQGRPDLHDKFWRYMSLFSDTVGNHE